jgi:hypothetical protein
MYILLLCVDLFSRYFRKGFTNAHRMVKSKLPGINHVCNEAGSAMLFYWMLVKHTILCLVVKVRLAFLMELHSHLTVGKTSHFIFTPEHA